jgi:hypothetical protein
LAEEPHQSLDVLSSGGQKGFSPLSALPAEMLPRNSGVGRDLKHSFASFRLIDESALQDGGVEGLAERL